MKKLLFDIRWRIHEILVICLMILVSDLARADDFVESLSSSAIIGEVIAKADTPYALDWRKSSAICEIGPLVVLDNNSFKSSGLQFMVGLPLRSGHLIRGGIRHISVESTSSSTMLARTPFTQSALMTRFEFIGSYGFNLLEGRNISKLSSTFGDLETVFWATAGGHYSLPDREWYPINGRTPRPLPAQDAVNSPVVLDLGLMWQVFFPNAFGIMTEFSYHFPIEGTGQLSRWNSIAVGLTWAFGVH